MSEPDSSTDPLIGRLLGDFVVQDKLGEGGFGAVYRAEQPLLARQAVIKVLHGRHRAAGDVIQRFLREAKLASKLDHPYAAHTYAFGAEPDGLLWIAMELVRGTPLDRLLATTGAVSLERFVPLLDKLCEVLATAHEQGIVHRDIKPANVMVLARAGRLLPKLLDFGIAKALDSEPVLGPAAAMRFESGPIALDPGSAGDVTARGSDLDRTIPTTGQAGDGSGPIHLTRAGAVLGSPPYMAPEQWVNAPNIGPASDLYALGALAFEALTGKPPFVARSMMAMARAHAQSPVPSLGEGFPAALDRVLQKAMAKRPEARYQGALELAAAFREAAGFAAEPDSLPRLDETVREEAIVALPQPLAEAVAGFEAARNLHQAYEALGEIVAIAAHLVGLIALCARSRVGAGAGDSPAAQEMLRILRRRTLADAEWIDLARALLRPFAERRDAHPLPELVTLFDVDDPFAALFTVFTDRGRAPAGESETRTRLERALPAAQRLLRALAFLGDYPLAVARRGAAERWVGLRRGRRTSTPLPRPVDDGQPLLLGRDDAPVLLLWPLVQVAEPVPGSPEELFLFEGQGRHASRLVARPGGFERRDDEIWVWMRAHFGGDEAKQQAEEEERAPYRGLSAFTSADADRFVGRERETEVVVNRLRGQPFVAVVGPSGAGKSSFVHAGVVPALSSEWTVVSLRPGSSPLQSLCVRIAGATNAPALQARLRAEPGALRELLCARDHTTMLVVDQFEEVFTLGSDEPERRAFVEAIAAATRSADDPVRVVITLRDDFLMRAEGEPALRPRLQRGLQLVGTPSREDLERILVEPARRAGYDFEDRALPAEMVAGVAGRAGALPMLSFTAGKLWELRDRHFKQLPRKVYDAIGGVAGALAQHAEETLRAMSADDQRLVREAFRHLVTAEGTRAVLSRAELLQLLGGGADAVIEKLVTARLLSASEQEGGGDRIEVAHEALLVAWPLLVSWRQEDAEGARLRDQLRAAARQWDERAKPDGLLWRDEAVAELQVWRARHGTALTTVDGAFADASVALATRGRRRARALAIGALVVLAAGSIGLFALSQRARASERVARAQVAELYEDSARQALLDDDPARALVYLHASMSGGRQDAGARFLLGQALAGDAPLQRSIEVGAGQIIWAEASADKRRVLALGDAGDASLWDVDQGKALVRYRDRGVSSDTALCFGANERYVVLAHEGTLRWLEPLTGAELASRPFPVGEGAIIGPFAIGRDGARVWAARGARVAVWDARTQQQLYTFDAEESLDVYGLVASLDGRWLATGGEAGHLRVRRASDGALAWSAELAVIRSLAFSGDGGTLAIGLRSGDAQVRDSARGSLRAQVRGHAGAIVAIALSTDGATLLTGSNDKSARVWDTGGGRLIAALVGHRGLLTEVQLSPDASRALTLSTDGTQRVWDTMSGRALGVLSSGSGLLNLVTWDGERSITYGFDGALRVWSTRLAERIELLDAGGTVSHGVLDDDGTTLFVGNWERETRAFRLGRRQPLSKTPMPQLARPSIIMLSPRGDRLIALDEAAAGQDAALVLRTADGVQVARVATPGIRINSWSFSRDGRRVLLGLADGSARECDAATGAMLRILPGAAGPLRTLWTSPDGSEAAAGCEGDSKVHRWDLHRGIELGALEGHTAVVMDVSYSDDGTMLGSVSADRTAKMWRRDGQLLSTLQGHLGSVSAIAFRGDASLVATGSLDGTTRVWSPTSGRLLATLPSDARGVWWVKFDRSGGRILCAGYDESIKVWSVPSATMTVADLGEVVRCRLGLRLANGEIVRATDTTSCASP